MKPRFEIGQRVIHLDTGYVGSVGDVTCVRSVSEATKIEYTDELGPVKTASGIAYKTTVLASDEWVWEESLAPAPDDKTEWEDCVWQPHGVTA